MSRKRKRNLNEKCKDCPNNEKSMAFCFSTCDFPHTILHNFELKRDRNDIPGAHNVAKVPPNIRGVHYYSKCPCGGMIDVYRMKDTGMLHAKCDSCGFVYTERGYR